MPPTPRAPRRSSSSSALSPANGGAAPTWNSTSTGCAASYCHGNFKFNNVTGANATPLWTDTTPLTCTSCHGMPPAGHPALSGTVTAATCSACHPQAVNSDGTINAAGGAHLNGKSDVSGCSSCHGDSTRVGTLAGTDANLTSAPPLAPAGAPSYAVGDHQGHLNPTAAGAMANPIACSECHAVPADSTHATNPPAQIVVFGTLATTGGAAPTWNATATGCAASYCHGNFNYNNVTGANATPSWTDTAPLTCTSCHGMPPTGHPAITGTPNAASCNGCHPQSVNRDGTLVLTGHLNGKADGGSCTACHGDPPTTGSHGDHKSRSCDACHPSGYNSTTIVPAYHQNGVVDIGPQAGYSCGLTGCPTGTRGTCTNSCHKSPQTWGGD